MEPTDDVPHVHEPLYLTWLSVCHCLPLHAGPTLVWYFNRLILYVYLTS